MSAPHVVTVTEAPDGIDIVVTCPDPKTCPARDLNPDDPDRPTDACLFADTVNNDGAEALDRVVVGPDLSLLDVMWSTAWGGEGEDTLKPGTYLISGVSIEADVDDEGRSYSYLAADETITFTPAVPKVDAAWLRSEALGTLGEWLEGYSTPHENGVQYRTGLFAIDRSGALHVTVKAAGEFSYVEQDGQTFIVDVTVTAVP